MRQSVSRVFLVRLRWSALRSQLGPLLKDFAIRATGQNDSDPSLPCSAVPRPPQKRPGHRAGFSNRFTVENECVADPHPCCEACCLAPKPLQFTGLRIPRKWCSPCRVAFRHHRFAARRVICDVGLYKFDFSQHSMSIAVTFDRPRRAPRKLIKL